MHAILEPIGCDGMAGSKRDSLSRQTRARNNAPVPVKRSGMARNRLGVTSPVIEPAFFTGARSAPPDGRGGAAS